MLWTFALVSVRLGSRIAGAGSSGKARWNRPLPPTPRQEGFMSVLRSDKQQLLLFIGAQDAHETLLSWSRGKGTVPPCFARTPCSCYPTAEANGHKRKCPEHPPALAAPSANSFLLGERSSSA